MSTTDFNDPESMLEEEATLWLLERGDGFAPGRAEAFAQWRNKNTRHAAAVARVERTLALLDEMPVIREPLVARVAGIAAKPEAKLSARRPRLLSWAWAAGLAAAVVLGASTWWLSLSPAIEVQTYATLAAEPQRVSLADGSVVDLNVNSRVEVHFSAGERHVILAAGEAHFQVAHNQTRPFIVTANGVTARAVGTAFNVRLVGDKVDVLVAEGKVEVARQEASAFFQTKNNPVIPLLVAGERTQVASHSETVPQIDEVPPAELHALLSWQNRMTSFVDVPLSEMVARINRCNSLQLALGDSQLGDRKVGGVIDLSKVNAFVHLLEQDGDIIADRGSAGKIVLRRAR